VSQGNLIYDKRDYADNIYFIVNGRANLLFGRQDDVFRTIPAGLYIGDIEVVK
jgi:hyperpolarization activated cyclic nucleotide-gated potassium channel 1